MTSKTLYRIIELQFFIVWLMAVVIPKSQFKTIFVTEILFFFVVAAYNIRRIKNLVTYSKQGRYTWWVFVSFFVLSALMLYFSYENIPSYWGIHLLPFERQYIPRHFMVIAELFLSIGLGFTMMRSGNLFKIKKLHLIMVSVLLAFLMVYNRNYVIFLGGLFVAVTSLLAFKTNFKFLFLLIPLVMYSHSAYVIAAIVMLMFLFLRSIFRRFFSSFPTERIIILLILLVVVMLVFREELYIAIRRDNNAYWRFLVWTNEIESLAMTYFTGVGFGSAYVTSDIYNIVNNANMYIDEDGNMYDRFFLVANHNSVLNMFYRLGLLGGLLFVAWNIMICSMCLLSYKKKILKEHNDYCWWAFTNYMYNLVIILFNPGMEMMQFAINYVFSLGIMFAILFSTNAEIKRQSSLSRGAAFLDSWYRKRFRQSMR